MDTSTVILHIAIILIAARFFGEIVAYFGAPSVIGEIVAGIILGPTVFDLIQPGGMIQVLAEIGIIMLLFQIGLETNVGDLIKAGHKSVVVALGGFLLPFVSCFALSYYVFSLPELVSLLIAGTMTATSIGITMRSLGDIGRGQSFGRKNRTGCSGTRRYYGRVIARGIIRFLTTWADRPWQCCENITVYGGVFYGRTDGGQVL